MVLHILFGDLVGLILDHPELLFKGHDQFVQPDLFLCQLVLLLLESDDPFKLHLAGP